jgi:hypothetical protein
MIWVFLSILNLWWCLKVWIWYVILDWVYVGDSCYENCLRNDMLNCLCFIREHVLKHDSWYEMYCFKAGGIIIWTINRTSEWGI